LLIAGVSTAATEIATIEAQTAATTQTPTPSPALPLVTPSETPSATVPAEPTPEPTPVPTTAPTTAPTPESTLTPTPVPTAEPSPEPSAEPTPPPSTAPPAVDPARFKSAAGKHLNDFEKGLNAMSTAMSEFNNPLVVANAARLALNAKQLKALESPENIAEEWTAANEALTSLVAEMKVAVKAEDYPTLTNLVEAGHLQVAAMRDIVSRAE
ncbi:MAG TPA: hypothetical protein VGI08_06060, partial [Diaminobutyricibacter sp.]